jgi:hypothetical protein
MSRSVQVDSIVEEVHRRYISLARNLVYHPKERRKASTEYVAMFGNLILVYPRLKLALAKVSRAIAPPTKPTKPQ